MERSSPSASASLMGNSWCPTPASSQTSRWRCGSSHDASECDRSGTRRKVRVEPGRPEAPVFAVRPRAGDVFATVGGLVPGALVNFFRDDEAQPFLFGAATRRVSTINLPSGWSADRLSIRQRLCAELESEATTVRVKPAVPTADLRVIDPLVTSAAAVAVTSLQAPGSSPIAFNPGSHLRVFSHRWHGVIGEAVALGDWSTTIELWLPLIPGDRIWVEASRGGASRSSPVLITEPAPPSVVTVLPPVLDLDHDGTIDDCTGTIRTIVEAGVIVDIEQVPNSAFPADTAGILLSSARSGGGRSLPVPPLEPKALVRARARRSGNWSQPSTTVRVVDRGPTYEDKTTKRLCALTGASDPVDRPHHQDTREFSLRGTDLGIPVQHRGRLWFFFGDSDKFDFGPLDFYGDDDPFGWTDDDPEPDGPPLHFVTESTSFLLSNATVLIGAAGGGILGTIIGVLISRSAPSASSPARRWAWRSGRCSVG